MIFTHSLTWFLGGAALLALALVMARVLRRSSASSRRGVLLLGAAAAVAVLPMSWFAPGLLPATAAEVALEDGFVMNGSPMGDPAVSMSPAPTAPAAATVLRAPSLPSAPVFVGALWLIAAASLLAGRAVAWRRVRRWVQQARVAPEAFVRDAKLAGAALAVPPVPVLLSPEVDTPMVIGGLRPRVLLPMDALEWDATRRSSVLLHEFAHVAQRDGWALGLAGVVCALRWFDPLAWRVARELRDECEAAADDLVLRSGVRPSVYASTLLALAVDAHGLAPALPMARRSGLEERVRRILAPNARREPASRTHGALAAGAAFTMVLGVACARPAPSVDAEETVTAGSEAEPSRGDTLELAVAHELENLVVEYRPRSVAIVVLDPRDSRILATAEHGRGLGRAFEPGSTLKPFTHVTALAAGLAPDAVVDGHDGQIEIEGTVYRDWRGFGPMSVTESLVRSSNVGTIELFRYVGPERLAAQRERVGLPQPAGSSTDAAVRASFGLGMTVTPLELAAAYGALAGDGTWRAASLDGGAPPTPAAVDPAALRLLRPMLEAAVHDAHATGRRAAVAGTRVAGKTGTTLLPGDGGEYLEGHTQATFVGMVPADEPRLVVLVTVEDPDGGGAGGRVAAPAFARIVRASGVR